MSLLNLAQLEAFVKIVQLGSYSRAAEVLNVRRSHLSRVVAQLEAQLGVKLLERTTRSLSVTEMGRAVCERAVGMLAAAEDTLRIAQEHQGEPSGTLRLTCAVEFGLMAVSAWVNEYLRQYPKTACEVQYDSRRIDLVHEGFDLAIRVGALEDSALAARRLGTLHYGLYACPRYLKKQGLPKTVAELSTHALLMFNAGSQRSGWSLQNGNESFRVEGPARLRADNSFALRHAILQSMGIAQLPAIVAEESLASGRMVQVLPSWARAPVPVHAVFPSNRYLAPKVRAFIDLAVARFPGPPSTALSPPLASLR